METEPFPENIVILITLQIPVKKYFVQIFPLEPVLSNWRHSSKSSCTVKILKLLHPHLYHAQSHELPGQLPCSQCARKLIHTVNFHEITCVSLFGISGRIVGRHWRTRGTWEVLAYPKWLCQ